MLDWQNQETTSLKNDNCIGTFTSFGSLEVSRLAIDIVRVVIKNDFNKNRHHVIFR